MKLTTASLHDKIGVPLLSTPPSSDETVYFWVNTFAEALKGKHTQNRLQVALTKRLCQSPVLCGAQSSRLKANQSPVYGIIANKFMHFH